MRGAAVILLAAGVGFGPRSLCAQGVGQYGRKRPEQGPRAIGLVRVSSSGKARLTPVAIMMNGKFFDAASYGATPVPMALDFGVIYQGFRSGVSQGTFTITQPGQLNHTWIAEGSWLPEGVKPPETGKKYETPKIEDKDAPPVLKRPKTQEDKDGTKPVLKRPKTQEGDEEKKDESKTGSGTADKKDEKTEKTADKASSQDAPITDPNRPILRRGKPPEGAKPALSVTFEIEPTGDTGQVFPAISDVGGADPRSYVYDLKPAELAGYRTRMVDLAATQLGDSLAVVATSPSGGKAATPKKPGKATTAKPQFESVDLRIFDLSSSNEPILVLSARTPAREVGTAGKAVPLEITLIARTNLDGELQKLFFARTDSLHLDVKPRMELIDAVDADGDGRGEFLFRETSDAGSFYAIYRVTADGLWSLYEGTP